MVNCVFSSELVFQLSLCDVQYIGPIQAKNLHEHFGSARAIFNASYRELEKINDIGPVRAKNIKKFHDFGKAEKEIQFLQRYGITSMYLGDTHYPRRLHNCPDPPTMLFFKGTADLNASRLVAIVGTRNNSEYGKSFTEKLIRKLSAAGCIVVSGLAYGIDTIVHKCALKNNIPTIGVVAHGLDTIYPVQNSQLAREMLKNGGLLTEFRSRTKPDKHNFPSRNRVVAGICDATIIIESGVKGGSMITAEMANDYNKDVFAVPGRNIDVKSSGCNQLIRNNKAILLQDPEQFLETMGWTDTTKSKKVVQKEFFIELNATEKSIVELLRNNENLNIDDLNASCGISSSTLAAMLLNLEMHGVLQSLPDMRYRLCDN